MKHTRQFIKDAVAAGWKPTGLDCEGRYPAWIRQAALKAKFKERYFLDPLAWQAVGKTREWQEPERGDDFPEATVLDLAGTGWNARLHLFIDHLCDGLSIEDALSKIV